jgi:hypothetical protein
MLSPRFGHTATLLLNGQVLVAGGYHLGTLYSAELYDPTSETWTAANPMNTNRWSHTATLLPKPRPFHPHPMRVAKAPPGEKVSFSPRA